MPKIVDPDTRRAEVVMAASKLLTSQGPEALSMRKIADQAGCTIGLINHWFSSKDELISAVLDQAIASASERTQRVDDMPGATPEDVFREFLPLDEEKSEELKIWLIFWALSIGRPKLRQVSNVRLQEIRQRLHNRVDDSDSISSDTERFVDTIMATLDGIAINALSDPDYWTGTRQKKTLRWLLDRITN
ncbi:MAG: TetR/AcrR family transcriptional regulator [Pseudomonadota bacterium]